jgi:hypothetical protein
LATGVLVVVVVRALRIKKMKMKDFIISGRLQDWRTSLVSNKNNEKNLELKSSNWNPPF